MNCEAIIFTDSSDDEEAISRIVPKEKAFPHCQLAYDTVLYALDEYLQMGHETSRLCLENFHGFLGMLGSLDCTDSEWFGCPVSYKGKFCRRDHDPNPFILLEVVASQDLWICHAFFGVSGANNDINVVHQSPLFNDLKERKASEVPYLVNDVTYPWGYYLVDGIYPEWSTFVKTISNVSDNDHKRIPYKRM
ncbi:ALP1-like protein isoform X1 [Tanacetum coccineum]